MTAITDLLNQIAAGLSIAGVPPSPEPGVPFTAGLAPPLGPVSITSIIQAPLSLDLIAKQVVFSNTDHDDPNFLAGTDIVKVLPLFDLAHLTPVLDPDGVPGLVGKLTGQLPIPVVNSAIPSIVKLQWSLQKEDERTHMLVDAIPGEDFLTPGGFDVASLILTMLPAFVRYGGNPVDPAKLYLSVKGTLSMAGESVDFTVGPLTILVPTLAIPELLVLSRDKNHLGPALVMVRSTPVPISLNTLRTIIAPVRSAISALQSIARFAAMVTGIETLAGVLAQTNLAFVQAKRTEDLNNFDLASGWINDTEAENELSSFIFLGPAGSSAAMYVAREYHAGNGRFVVSTGQSLLAVCRDLHSATPVVFPSDASLTVTNPPVGTGFPSPFPSPASVITFGDSLSSIEFLP